MRAIQIVFVGLVLLTSGWARATDACAWTDPGKKPRLYLDDRVVVFRDYYPQAWATCAIGRGSKDLEVQWMVGTEPQVAIVATEKIHLYGGDDEPARKAEAKLYPSALCEKAGSGDGGPPRRDRLVTGGGPGKEYVAPLTTVRARVVATGVLAPLAFTSPPIEVALCHACGDRSGGSLSVRSDENGKDLVLEGEVDRAWFECASRGATLTLRGFGGQSRTEVTTAIRPDLTIPGLEKEFARRGDKYVLRKVLPLSRLCAHGAKVWSFESWGRGELMHLDGGGRSIYDVRCQ
jgi:hypothetical protein